MGGGARVVGSVLGGAEELPGTETLRGGDIFGGFNTFG